MPWRALMSHKLMSVDKHCVYGEKLRRCCLRERGSLDNGRHIRGAETVGVFVKNRRIVGRLDLSDTFINHELWFVDCEFTDEINLTDAILMQGICLKNCAITSLKANHISVRGDVVLDRVKASETVSLEGGKLSGELRCSGSKLGFGDSSNGVALNGREIAVEGSVFFDESFESWGDLVLVSARIKGLLSFESGTCRNPEAKSVDADGLTVEGEVLAGRSFKSDGEFDLGRSRVGGIRADRGCFLNINGFALTALWTHVDGGVSFEDCTIHGGINLSGVHIEEELEFRKASIKNCGGSALQANGLRCNGSVYLDKKFEAHGEVEFIRADIRGKLDCSRGTFHREGGWALNGDAMTCGRVFLGDGFRAYGGVRFAGARIDGELTCSGGNFGNGPSPDGSALELSGLMCGRSIFLNERFTASGTVELVGARIENELNCTAGSFTARNGVAALRADAMLTKGNVYLDRGFAAVGFVSLINAVVERELNCTGGSFGEIRANGLKVGHMFKWRPKEPPPANVNFSGAELGHLDDSMASWPKNSKMTGLVFKSVNGEMSREDRCKWLEKADGDVQNVFQQLHNYYRSVGRDRDAETVIIHSQRQRSVKEGGSNRLSKKQRIWSRFLDVSVGYGYKPHRAIIFLLTLGTIMIPAFLYAQNNNLMTPTAVRESADHISATSCTRDYPCFMPWTYSYEILFPVVNLRQINYWLPSPAAGLGGSLLLCYVWIAIVIGWAAGIAVIAGIENVVRHRL